MYSLLVKLVKKAIELAKEDLARAQEKPPEEARPVLSVERPQEPAPSVERPQEADSAPPQPPPQAPPSPPQPAPPPPTSQEAVLPPQLPLRPPVKVKKIKRRPPSTDVKPVVKEPDLSTVFIKKLDLSVLFPDRKRLTDKKQEEAPGYRRKFRIDFEKKRITET